MALLAVRPRHGDWQPLELRPVASGDGSKEAVHINMCEHTLPVGGRGGQRRRRRQRIKQQLVTVLPAPDEVQARCSEELRHERFVLP